MNTSRRSFFGSLLGFFGAASVPRLVEASPKPSNWPFPPVSNETDPNETLHTDLFEMFDRIKEHTLATGDVILSADNPRVFPPRIGFWAQPADDGPGRGWSITVVNLKKSLDARESLDSPKSKMVVEIARDYIRTGEGRSKLARSFPGQRKPIIVP